VSALLQLSRLIDRISEFMGRWLAWLVLIMVLISAANATYRKAFSDSSNAFLEIQWYLFAAVFLVGAGYTLLRQEHVRIDVILGRFTRRTQVKVEIFGIVAFLMPLVFSVVHEVWPLVVQAFHSGEMSENAGGLVRWPVYAMVPIGFTLLGLQGLSELIKRIGFLQGLCADPGVKKKEKTAEEELAETIRAREEAAEREAAAKGGAQ
jgi:TRAP-type mannitol/chloroaromatic compound transport system permease small subunit